MGSSNSKNDDATLSFNGLSNTLKQKYKKIKIEYTKFERFDLDPKMNNFNSDLNFYYVNFLKKKELPKLDNIKESFDKHFDNNINENINVDYNNYINNKKYSNEENKVKVIKSFLNIFEKYKKEIEDYKNGYENYGIYGSTIGYFDALFSWQKYSTTVNYLDTFISEVLDPYVTDIKNKINDIDNINTYFNDILNKLHENDIDKEIAVSYLDSITVEIKAKFSIKN